MVRAAAGVSMETIAILKFAEAAIAQLGERQTEDLKVPGSIPGLGTGKTARAGARMLKLRRCQFGGRRSTDGRAGSLSSSSVQSRVLVARGAAGVSMGNHCYSQISRSRDSSAGRALD